MERPAKPRRNLVFSAVFFILAILSGFTIVLWSNNLFPDNGGFNRTIIFVRPEPGSDDPGYFLIIDEFDPKDTVEVLFHSYGDLTYNETGRYAIFNQSGTEMKLNFFGPEVDIENDTGIVYNSGNTREVNYIKVKPLGEGTRRLVTVMTFKNATVDYPPILDNILDSSYYDHIYLVINGSDHFTIAREHRDGTMMNRDGIRSGGYLTGYRLNATNDLDWIILKDTFLLEVNDTEIHGGDPISGFYDAPTNSTELANQGQGDVDQYETSTPFSDAMLANLQGLTHPYMLFNETGLLDLRSKCNGTGVEPWKTWYASVRTGGDIASRALRAKIEEDQAYIDLATQMMLDLDIVYPDWYGEQFITQSTRLYPYLFAYDMLYNNISAANRTLVEGSFKERLLNLWDAAQAGTQPHNNHIVVGTAALGIGGVLFKNQSWIQMTQDENDYYLEHNLRPDGPCYEGDIYGRYAYENAIKFFLALKNAGGYDYFSNPKFQKYLNYTASSVTPLGTTPSFEDCAVNLSLYRLASIAAYQVNETNPALASNLRWYFEFSQGSYTGGADVYRIASYREEISPQTPDLGPNPGYAYFDSGQACVRTGWGPGSTFLVISNKNYHQSHVHYDENSIEVYALGKQFLTNPGYPGFGNPGHDSTIATEGSNSVLINGEGQLWSESNGFSACIQNERVDLIESPCYSAYASPIRLAHNPGNLLVLGTIIFCLVAIGAIQLYKYIKPKAGESNGKEILRVEKSPGLLLAFDEQRLLSYDFSSRKLPFFSILLLTGISSVPNLVGTQRLIQYAVEQVQYLNMSASLRDFVYEIAPTVTGVMYIVVPLLVMAILSLFILFQSIIFHVARKIDGDNGRSFKESIGVTYKYWTTHGIMFVVSAVGVLFIVYEGFIHGLFLGQTQGEGGIYLANLLKDILGNWVVFFTAVNVLSLPVHLISMRTLNAFGRQNGESPQRVKSQFVASYLFLVALLLILYLAAYFMLFPYLTSISIENNPLK